MKNYFLAILLFFCLSSFAQIARIEPPFWWAKMERENLQLMVYGENIASYKISAEKPLRVQKIDTTENSNYLFLTINSQELDAGSYNLEFKKEGSKTITQSYEIKKREQGSRDRKGFDASDAIYLLMPDRFANAVSGNDSNPHLTEKVNRQKQGGRHGGDIQGIIANLDYLEDLGVTAIWSTPMLEDNDPEYSYHTYAQSDVYRIDPRYGSNQDYKRLATELHKRDMKLIMDYVTNHWGAQHWMIKDLPTYDWIHQFPGYANSNYRMTTQYDPHRSKRDLRYCVDGWFVRTMPDLNQSNPLVLNYLIQNAIWWIEFSGLDGFRVDTYSYNNKESIAKWTRAVMQEYPNFNIVGEVWMHDQAQISYWQKDSPIGAIQNYNSHLPSVMDFTLHDAIIKMLDEEKAEWNKGIIHAYENFVNDFLYPNTDNLLVFAGNHDTNRINEIYKGNFEKYKLALTLVLTTRGIPQIYYGDEIGMRGDRSKGDGDIRRDFPGGWEKDTQSAFVEAQRTDIQQKYHSFTRKLLNYRKNKEVLHFGKLLQYIPEDNVYVYFRYNDTGRVLIVLNNAPEARELELSRLKEGLNGHTTGKELFYGETLELKDKLVVNGKQALVIELQ